MFTNEDYKKLRLEHLKKGDNCRMLLSVTQIVIPVITFLLDFCIGYFLMAKNFPIFMLSWLSVTCVGYMTNKVITDKIERRMASHFVIAKYYYDMLLN